MRAERELLVVGGGVTGLSVAVHAARRGLSTTLVEAQAIGGVSTQRSGALVRTHYPDEGSGRMALRGLEHFESFEQRYGAPAGFVATGFAYVPSAEEVETGALAQRVEMLRGIGVDTELLDPRALAEVDPALRVQDVPVVAYEPRSGYADPAQTTAALAGAAAGAGVELMSGTPAESLLLGAGGAVSGARTREGELSAGATVLCCGAWARALAAGAGVELPLEPTAVKLARVQRRVERHLTVIDAANGIYFRPDGPDATLVGRRTWTDEPLPGPDAALPEVGEAFALDAARRLAARLPSAHGAPGLGGRAGMLDMTPDGLPLVGPTEVDGLWACCGWSGTGFKTAPAVGEALAGWLAGEDPPSQLAAFEPRRAPAPAAAVRSPH